MKKRIITAIVAVIGAIVIILLSEINSIFLLVPICAFCVISVHELIGVIKIKSKMLKATSMVYAGIVPFLVAGDASYAGFFGKSIPINLHTILILVTILYVLVVLHSLLKHYTSVKFETVATLMFGTIVVSLGLSLLPAFHALYHYYPNVFSKGDSMFLMIYSMAVCWTFDGGAYFIGSKFGKHKMAPNISPKKSWEGYIGGIVIGEIFTVLYFILFNTFATADYKPAMFNVVIVAIISPILATLSIMGDLSASTIKRNFGVKDFGNFFPGHGGILDRYDSVLYVAPILYAICKIMVMIKT